MKIWVDADACPKVIKEVLYRAAIRTQTPMILVANQAMGIPPSAFIKTLQVSSGFDVADNHIVDNVQEGDLVITADIPLANSVVDKGAFALNPRGELYTKDNIKQRFALRNVNEELRNSGVIRGGPPALGKPEIQAFANSLDSFLMKKGKAT